VQKRVSIAGQPLSRTAARSRRRSTPNRLPGKLCQLVLEVDDLIERIREQIACTRRVMLLGRMVEIVTVVRGAFEFGRSRIPR
jgi:hypothetical protein